jgi:hypothetical protein
VLLGDRGRKQKEGPWTKRRKGAGRGMIPCKSVSSRGDKITVPTNLPTSKKKNVDVNDRYQPV